MASSEIDAIFASKHKPGATQESVSSISNQPVKSRKKDKKSKRDPKPPKPDLSVIHDPEKIPNPSKKRPAPETIIDPSVHVASVKRQKCPSTPKGAKPGGRTKNQEPDAGGNFNDSRGSTSRKRTEEGWAVYKEDELGIGDQGGDTPLCPFDCDCFYQFTSALDELQNAAPSKPHEFPHDSEVKWQPKIAPDLYPPVLDYLMQLSVKDIPP